MKKKHQNDKRYWVSAIQLDTSYLRYPTHQTVQVLPQQWSENIYKQAQLADFLAVPLFENKYIGYSDIEIQKIKRTYDWMQSAKQDGDLLKKQFNFGKYFQAHDDRRGTDFKKVFPEFTEFFEWTKTIKL